MVRTRMSSLLDIARRSSCASREGRPPDGEGSECEPTSGTVTSSTERPPTSRASAAVGAPTSGASRRRVGPRRADRREHAGPRCAVQRRGSPKALAGRIRRDVAHVRAAHFRPGYSGGAGRGWRRVSSTKKSGCSRAPHHPQPPGEWLGWPSSFGGPCAPPISVSSRDRAQGFPSRRRRWRCRGPCAYTERLRAPLVTALAGPGAFLSL